MIQIFEEKQCCGCGACSKKCPQQCISMTEKTLGHLFPSVDISKCIDCGLCESVCPELNEVSTEAYQQSVYAAYAIDEETRFQGSSGGIFGVLAKEFIGRGGIVYGAAFDGELKLKCTSAETCGELKPIYKSKYIQSDLSEKYEEIERKLAEGKRVLFVSTPCQVSALKRFLGKENDLLTTVDFFCHGVPSQRLFDECVAFENQKNKGTIKSYQFRTKIKNGATPHYFSAEVEENGEVTRTTKLYFKSPFYAFFQKYISLRESCYKCKFAGKQRASDITIGDFHEIDQYEKGINRFEGVSKVVINSSKGHDLWNQCTGNVKAFPMKLEVLMQDGNCFGTGTERPSQRDQFLEDYSNLSIGELIDKWVGPQKYRKQNIYYHLPAGIRRALKHILGA